MQSQKGKNCNRTECADLLEELTLLKQQLQEAEDQLQAVVPESQHSFPFGLEYSAYDNFDLSNTSEVVEGASSDGQSKGLFERYGFYSRIERLVNDAEVGRVESGSLLFCIFTDVAQPNIERDETAVRLNELQMIDEVINSCTRAGDLTAFITHYERAVFIPNDPDGAVAGLIAEKLIRATKHYQPPKTLESLSYKCSIGISIFPNDAVNVDTLFRYADRAAYAALKVGDSYYSYYL